MRNLLTYKFLNKPEQYIAIKMAQSEVILKKWQSKNIKNKLRRNWPNGKKA